MSILLSIGRIATEYSAARGRARTRRILRALPLELRRDIGLLGIVDEQPSRPVGIQATIR